VSDQTDSFIQEVTEEVRKDQMFALWKKWAPLIIGAVLLIVGGTAYWSWSEAQSQAAAEARGGALLAADRTDAEYMASLAEAMDGEAALLAEFGVAAALAEDGRRDAARDAYLALADRTGLTPRYADLARLQAARLTEGEAGMALLDRLAAGDGPYRLLALEERAARLINAGETEKGHADLNAILNDPALTQSLFQRAFLMLQATGGEAMPVQAPGAAPVGGDG